MRAMWVVVLLLLAVSFAAMVMSWLIHGQVMELVGQINMAKP